MANHYIKKDGAWKVLNDSQFEEEFGYAPTTPRTGETSFGGRYEHHTWNQGDVANDNDGEGSGGDKNTGIWRQDD